MHTAIFPSEWFYSILLAPFSVQLQDYLVQLHDNHVMRGNTAVFKCNVPRFVKDYVNVTAWTRSSSLIHSGERMSSVESQKGVTAVQIMFHWEPERHYRHRLCTVIAPFWFSMKHLWIAITPFWLSLKMYTYYRRSPVRNPAREPGNSALGQGTSLSPLPSPPIGLKAIGPLVDCL